MKKTPASSQMTEIPDLFAATPANADTLYTQLQTSTHPDALRIRNYLVDLWQTYYPYRDATFLTQFPLNYHDRWFEMYLTVCLLRRGAGVQPPAGRKQGRPDILVKAGEQRIWIEAVCATGGKEGLPDSIREVSAGTIPWNKIAVRIRAAVYDKQKRYSGYLADGIVKPQDALIIAVNVQQVPYAAADFERYVFRAMYGIGDQVIHLSKKTLEQVGSDHKQLEFIPKANNSPVGTQPFTDESMAEIAGLIVSSHSASQRAIYGDSLDLTLYPNLTSHTPWTPRVLPLDREWEFAATDEGWSGALSTNS